MFVMQYKDYTGQVEFDDEAGFFHGHVVNLRDVITFQGTSVSELREALADSVEDYLEFCAELGEAPEKHLSGKFVLRVSPELHRHVADAAAREGKSLNSWARDVLEQAAQRAALRRYPDSGCGRSGGSA